LQNPYKTKTDLLMLPEMITIPSIRIIGMRTDMSIANNKVSELWRRFKPRIKEIDHRIGENFFSVQVYESPAYFKSFDPDARFEKWAAVEAGPHATVPEEMESMEIEGGLYAVFEYRGTPDMFYRTAMFIYGEWLPQSAYLLDNRPHFEIMEPGYGPVNPESTEKVYVPVTHKLK
jgi:AraC family transcriptional regulator